MSANKYSDHLLVLLEDHANRRILNGFSLHHSVNPRRLEPTPIAGGWRKVLEFFQDTHVTLMRKFPKRNVLIVLDFDGEEDRFTQARNVIPSDLQTRVFVLGCAAEPEALTKSLGRSEEKIGLLLAEDCDHGTNETWGHEMLVHNVPELARLSAATKSFLFNRG